MPSLNIELKNSSNKTVTETLPTPGWKEEKFNIYWTLKWSIFLLSMSPHELCVPVLQHLELQRVMVRHRLPAAPARAHPRPVWRFYMTMAVEGVGGAPTSSL